VGQQASCPTVQAGACDGGPSSRLPGLGVGLAALPAGRDIARASFCLVWRFRGSRPAPFHSKPVCLAAVTWCVTPPGVGAISPTPFAASCAAGDFSCGWWPRLNALRRRC